MNDLLGGNEPGDVIIAAGRPKSGKSSVSNNVLKYHAVTKIPILNCSGEMQNIKGGYRLAAAISGIATKKIERGLPFKSEWQNKYKELSESFFDALDMIEKSNIYFDDSPLSIPRMRSQIYRHHAMNGTKLFLYDRIGLFEELTKKGVSDWEARMAVTSAMRVICNEIGVTIIAYSQLSTDVERTTHKRADARHIFGGIGAQSNCTKAFCIYRPEQYSLSNFMDGPYKGQTSKGKAEIYTVLNNYGDLDSIKVNFIGARQMFADCDEDFDYPLAENVIIPAKSINNDEELPF